MNCKDGEINVSPSILVDEALQSLLLEPSVYEELSVVILSASESFKGETLNRGKSCLLLDICTNNVENNTTASGI